jgi:hemerythrin-like domain-containing protein
MEATRILMDEHRVIERVIAAIENVTARMQAGEEGHPEFFLKAADFIKGFADGCHHRKEEGVLFQSLLENGLPSRGGPVQMMLDEHEQGRHYTRSMRAAALAWQNGDRTGRAAAMENALGYAALLKQHIYKEDHVLFQMADRVIPLEQQAQVVENFEHVEHEETGEGVHEKFLALAGELEKEAAAPVK